MPRPPYARRTEIKRDDLRNRAGTDRPCADFYVVAAGAPIGANGDRPPGSRMISIKDGQPPTKPSSLWALQAREVVLAGRRAGLIHGGTATRTSAAVEGNAEALGMPR